VKSQHPILHSRVAFTIAVSTFIFLVSGHHPIKYFTHFNYFDLNALEIFAPCIIFGFTVDAYYHFITRYRGRVSGLTLIFLLLALLCCVGLVDFTNSAGNWWEHLKYVYFLFFTFVLWDIIMIEWLLKPINCIDEDKALTEMDMLEVKRVSYHINMPTLISILGVSIFCQLCVAISKVKPEDIKLFVAGVVSFHLIFSSAAYVFVRLQARDS
jgi:hypothetical protein